MAYMTLFNEGDKSFSVSIGDRHEFRTLEEAMDAAHTYHRGNPSVKSFGVKNGSKFVAYGYAEGANKGWWEVTSGGAAAALFGKTHAVEPKHQFFANWGSTTRL